MGCSNKFLYLRLFLILLLSRTDSIKLSKFPLQNCSMGDFDLLVVTDSMPMSDCFNPETPPSFTSQMIDMFLLPLEQTQTRLRVNIASYSSVTSRAVLHSSSRFNATQVQINSSTTANCSKTLQNQQSRKWTVLPIVDFVIRYFSMRSNLNENSTNVAVIVTGGPNPGAVEEIDRIQNGRYKPLNFNLFVIMVNFHEEVAKIALIPDTLHISTYSELINNQLILSSICKKCNPGWFFSEKQDSLNQISCYFLDISDSSQNWFSAYSRCNQLGADLASIETQSEVDFLERKLFEIMTQEYFNVHFNVFIGIKRDYKLVSKRFRWLSGSPLITSHWAGNSPNGGYILKCGIWVFVAPGTNVTLNETLELDLSVYQELSSNGWEDIGCGVRMSNVSLCEFVIETSRIDISLGIAEASLSSIKYVITKGEFIEHNGAVVSISAYAENSEFLSSLEKDFAGFELFNCEEGEGQGKLISYSYVCDHVQHCNNARDESICFYRSCDLEREFQCRSRQCVPRESRCDAYNDCYDSSDEEDCVECQQKRSCEGKCIPEHWFNDIEIDCDGCSGRDLYLDEKVATGNMEACAFICNRTSCVYPHQLGDGVVSCLGPEGQLDETIGKLERSDSCYAADEGEKWAPRCVYLKDRYGSLLGCEDMSHLWNCQSFKCPDGYVKCPDSYCIPLHLVQDGQRDCPLGEDEIGLNLQNCSGNFACSQSRVCLHLDLVCDGDPQCPGRDDELNCNVTCATGFRCISGTVIIMEYDLAVPLQSLSFVDDRTRYIDLSGVDISDAIIGKDVTHLRNLLTIVMSNCKLTTVSDVFSRGISNLQTVHSFDISRNFIEEISINSVFRYMSNLRILDLSYNDKLTVLSEVAFQAYYGESQLEVLDLRFTAISVLQNTVLQGLNNLKILNLSHTRITNLYTDSFPKDFTLHILDLRDTYISGYDISSFNGLSIKKSLFTDGFGLCCPQIRGSRIPSHTCHSPDDTISSCSHLVREQAQRVLLWIVGVVAVVANVTVILCRILWDRGIIRKAYGLFVTSLGISDLIMGIYLLTIAFADLYYKNDYVINGKIWKEGTTCQIAGFLSTLSSETSAFFTLLITLDRFIVIKFPFGQWNFSKQGMFIASAVVWVIGFILAVIPMLPTFSNWTVYSSNGMCIGLPLNADMLAGWRYSISVFVVLNSAIFLVIVVGQFSIYRAMSENRVTVSAVLNSNRRAQDISVSRKLSLVVLSNFLCWFPIGLMGLLALTGHDIAKSAYTWSAVLVMPINSALNPLLYTIPALHGKWKKFISGHSKQQSKRDKPVNCKGMDVSNICKIVLGNKE